MRIIYNLLALCFLLLCTTYSQEEAVSSNAPPSSLGLSADRSQEKRIEFLLEVAQAYSQSGDLQASIDAYERILKMDPDHLQARYVLAQLYITTKQYEKAEVTLLRLIKERPEDFTLLNNLAWLYATAEDPAIRDGQKAIDYAQKAMVLAPNDHHVWSTLSEAYYVSGEYEKAYRAITHMANLTVRSSQGVSEEAVEGYNEQIRKCQRALDTANAMKEDE